MSVLNRKICNCCKIEKDTTEYYKSERGTFGVTGICKPCTLEKSRPVWQAYKAANREKIRASGREYDQRNAEKIAKRKANYRDKNAEVISAKKKIYHAKIKPRRRSWENNKRATDPQFKLKCILRTRVSNFMINKGIKAGSAVKDLGCTIPEFKAYLESKFLPGMTWENHSVDGWHIDHIVPLCEFDLTNREQFLKAAHYTNLQPLWAEDNWKKNRFVLP